MIKKSGAFPKVNKKMKKLFNSLKNKVAVKKEEYLVTQRLSIGAHRVIITDYEMIE